jgi:SHS2 domain-containing protein
MGHFAFLDDIALADSAIEINGGDLGDLLETAASALAELMVDPVTVPATTVRAIAMSAPTPDLLLYEWLSELIYRKDRDGEIFTRTRCRVVGTAPLQLTAEARGGVIDRARTTLRADPKAVTFHQFSVESVDGGWRARVVIDI